MAVSGIILAGGRSSRMGRDKSLLELNNETIIERTVRELKDVTDEIVIASNSNMKYGLPGITEVPDIYPGRGPLAGLHAGLAAVKNQYAFVISCDMPFFIKELAIFLLTKRDSYDVVVPRVQGWLQPLCAVYSRQCLEPIEGCLRADIRKVYQFYRQVKVLELEEDTLRQFGNLDKLFLNLNTSDQYQLLKKLGTTGI